MVKSVEEEKFFSLKGMLTVSMGLYDGMCMWL